ncbi:MAG: hypothetical protein AVO33_10135 [delta proteobacterium ML8_F1]|nr:MAG: hypothetical protein AVO33_10135 [delta proteobacterium ML8_F1]
MNTLQRRANFSQTYEQMPVLMLQGSVGERIYRNFTRQKPEKPLGLAGLYYSENGHRGLDRVFHDYVSIAQKFDLPLLLHPYSKVIDRELISGTYYEDRNITADNYHHCQSIVDGYPLIREKVFIGTILGFSGDSYRPSTGLSEEEAYALHSKTTRVLETMDHDHARTGLSPALPEAAGAARALSETTLPYFVSFLVRRDGKLLDGTWLHDAIAYIDSATEKRPPLFYQVNCVHPRNMMKCLDQKPNRTELVRSRFRGLEANGSELSPEELDNAGTLHTSLPGEWADDLLRLYTDYGLKVLGGCCGTDHEHMTQLALRIRGVYDQLGL